jgi:hypothetical protein
MVNATALFADPNTNKELKRIVPWLLALYTKSIRLVNRRINGADFALTALDEPLTATRSAKIARHHAH